MRIVVDAARCEAHGECVLAAPELFDLVDDDAPVKVLGQPSGDDAEQQARDAENVCPVGAITIEA